MRQERLTYDLKSDRSAPPPRRMREPKHFRPNLLTRISSLKASSTNTSPIDSPTSTKSAVVISVRNKGARASDGTIDTMSGDSSRPQSAGSTQQAPQPQRRPSRSQRTAAYVRRPNLAEILANQGPDPWTLEAFRDFSERNHCLENLLFIQDADRYTEEFEQLTGVVGANNTSDSYKGATQQLDPTAAQQLRDKWTRLIELYIEAGSPQELNLTSEIRDQLVRHNNVEDFGTPDQLRPAVRKTYELIEESILFPFLNETQRQSSSDSDSAEADEPPPVPAKDKPAVPPRSSARKTRPKPIENKGGSSLLNPAPNRQSRSPKQSHFSNIFHPHHHHLHHHTSDKASSSSSQVSRHPESSEPRNPAASTERIAAIGRGGAGGYSSSPGASTLASLDTAMSSKPSSNTGSPTRLRDNTKSPPPVPQSAITPSTATSLHSSVYSGGDSGGATPRTPRSPRTEDRWKRMSVRLGLRRKSESKLGRSQDDASQSDNELPPA